MRFRFKPLHGILAFLFFMVLVVGGEYVLGGGLNRSYERVGLAEDGLVHVSTAELTPNDVHFFRYLNPGNQEVKFFVGRDDAGHLQVAFDANEICYKRKAGYRVEGEWLVCNKCDKTFRLAEVNAGGGGCRPVPLNFTAQQGEVLLTEADILQGWRYFR